MALPAWSEIVGDASWLAMDRGERNAVFRQYMLDLAAVPEWKDLSGEDKGAVTRRMLEDAGLMERDALPDRFAASFPNLYAAGKTIMETPRTLMSGATLGASEKALELGGRLADAAFGVESQPGADYEEIPETSRKVGEFVGAAAPIGLIGKGVGLATKIPQVAKVLAKNKYLPAAANMIGWGAGGTAYATAESLIKEGEAPTAKELAEGGAVWAGMEGALQALGWTGRFAGAVNTLAKITGQRRMDALKAVLAGAKELGLPVGASAKRMVKDAKTKQAWDEYLAGVEREAAKGYEESLAEQAGSLGAGEVKAVDGAVDGGVQADLARQGEKLRSDAIAAGQEEAAREAAGNVEVAAKAASSIETAAEAGGKVSPEKAVLRGSAGAVLGIKTDEEGNIGIDPTRAMLGMAGGVAAVKLASKRLAKGVPREIDVKTLRQYQEQASLIGKDLKDFLVTAKGMSHPDAIRSIQALQEHSPEVLFKTLRGIREKERAAPLPKRARSVNLEKQVLPEEVKEFEAELAELMPKQRVQTWAESEEKAKTILADNARLAALLNRAKEYRGLSAAEQLAVRQVNINALDTLKEMAETAESPEQMARLFNEYRDNIFKATSNAASETGRALNIYKKEVSVQRLVRSLAKLENGMNKRQLEEFRKLNMDDPIAVKHFIGRLDDPRLKDYLYEFWYNAILSGVPTHIVNVASNTAWMAWNATVHRSLVTVLDAVGSRFTGAQREYYFREIVPFLGGLKEGFKKGKSGAWEVVKTGQSLEFDSKWAREMSGFIGSFDRMPGVSETIRKPVSFLVAAPSRALRAMDVWANTMAYDAQMNALLTREGIRNGKSGKALKKYVEGKLANPASISREMMDECAEYAKYMTFMDDPGHIANFVLSVRDQVPLAKMVVPFVTTIGNLLKRGVEMTPGVGIAMGRGQKWQETVAKQIEGALLGLVVAKKFWDGDITGATPQNPAERDAFYRQGKLPWAIKVGDAWYQYRRMEPFNTVIASVAIGMDKLQNAKDDEGAAEIVGNIADGFVDNLLDSSYFVGMSSVLDKYGKREGMLKRSAASTLPYSGFLRSINRAAEAHQEGSAKVRQHETLRDAFAQVAPGFFGRPPEELDVFGQEKIIPGGALRQWLPYKKSEIKHDPVEEELDRLKIYPGMPGERVTIGTEKVELPDDLHRAYVQRFGSYAKPWLKNLMASPGYQRAPDEVKKKAVESLMDRIRSAVLGWAKAEYRRRGAP